MALRQIVPDDITQLMNMMEFMRAEAPSMQKVPVDRVYTGTNLSNMLDNGLLFGIISPFKGCILGLISGNWYDPRPMAFEQMLYVIPEARGTRLAVHLISAFVDEAESRGAAEVHVGSSTGIQDERTARLYEAMGFVRSGISLRKELHV